MGPKVDDMLKVVLLFIIPGPIKSVENVFRLLSAERAAIPRNCMSTVIPSLAELVVELDAICDLESLLSWENDKNRTDFITQ